MTLDKKTFENIVVKGENACNQHFLLFPLCFLLYQGHKSSFLQQSNLCMRPPVLRNPLLQEIAVLINHFLNQPTRTCI